MQNAESEGVSVGIGDMHGGGQHIEADWEELELEGWAASRMCWERRSHGRREVRCLCRARQVGI